MPPPTAGENRPEAAPSADSSEQPAIVGWVSDEAGHAVPGHPANLYDARSLTPVAREPIARTLTDSTGFFRFADLEAGAPYVVWFPPSDTLEGERQSVTAPAEGRAELRVLLLERRSEVQGRVLVFGSDRPVPGVAVTVGGHDDLRTRTDERGCFLVPKLARTSYRLRFEHASIPAGYEVYPVPGGEMAFLIYLPDPAQRDSSCPHPRSALDLVGREAPALAAQAWVSRTQRSDGSSDPDLARAPDLPRGPLWIRFFASWHGPSVRHLEALAREAQAHPEAPIVLLHHAGGWRKGLRRWLDAQALDLPLLLDTPSAETALGSLTFARFGIVSFPTDVMIDAGGRIRHVLTPPPDETGSDVELLLETWRRLLAE
ncbi:MAG: hypothetical protein AB1486_30330 [Planctomycetota bacterium]